MKLTVFEATSQQKAQSMLTTKTKTRYTVSLVCCSWVWWSGEHFKIKSFSPSFSMWPLEMTQKKPSGNVYFPSSWHQLLHSASTQHKEFHGFSCVEWLCVINDSTSTLVSFRLHKTVCCVTETRSWISRQCVREPYTEHHLRMCFSTSEQTFGLVQLILRLRVWKMQYS